MHKILFKKILLKIPLGRMRNINIYGSHLWNHKFVDNLFNSEETSSIFSDSPARNISEAKQILIFEQSNTFTTYLCHSDFLNYKINFYKSINCLKIIRYILHEINHLNKMYKMWFQLWCVNIIILCNIR